MFKENKNNSNSNSFIKRKALFLDRDGVINKEINYLYKIEEFIFNKGIFELCKYYKRRGFLIFIVTNQAGIARGYYTEEDYKILTKWMLIEFSKRGINIEKIYHCPHHPEFTGECTCRKPKPGMLKQAESEYDLNLANSVLIGDRISDIEAGNKAGVGLNILITSNELLTYLSVI